jgi:hypothetical protein
MKKMCITIILLMANLSVTGQVLAVKAQAVHKPVTAVEIPLCPPFGLGHPDCTPGEWSFTENTIHVRNWVQMYKVISDDDDRLIGLNTLIANANWDLNGYGPGWGTFRNQSSVYDGYWEGTWSAVMSVDGYVSHIVGSGYGEFAGLKIHAVEVNGVFDGKIIELP